MFSLLNSTMIELDRSMKLFFDTCVLLFVIIHPLYYTTGTHLFLLSARQNEQPTFLNVSSPGPASCMAHSIPRTLTFMIPLSGHFFLPEGKSPLFQRSPEGILIYPPRVAGAGSLADGRWRVRELAAKH